MSSISRNNSKNVISLIELTIIISTHTSKFRRIPLFQLLSTNYSMLIHVVITIGHCIVFVVTFTSSLLLLLQPGTCWLLIISTTPLIAFLLLLLLKLFLFLTLFFFLFIFFNLLFQGFWYKSSLKHSLELVQVEFSILSYNLLQSLLHYIILIKLLLLKEWRVYWGIFIFDYSRFILLFLWFFLSLIFIFHL